MRLDFDLEDLTNSALKRLVKQLLVAKDGEEKAILNKVGKAKNDLADLDEEMHGKPNTPEIEDDDDPFDDDEEPPKKKGKK